MINEPRKNNYFQQNSARAHREHIMPNKRYTFMSLPFFANIFFLFFLVCFSLSYRTHQRTNIKKTMVGMPTRDFPHIFFVNFIIIWEMKNLFKKRDYRRHTIVIETLDFFFFAFFSFLRLVDGTSETLIPHFYSYCHVVSSWPMEPPKKKI